ncbi:MAG: hypothetical protein LQ352_004238 [Teloschistes flavicans]|nr:MAG: hypothetical protein LQ352_004238 [Teloschistes flavicans]
MPPTVASSADVGFTARALAVFPALIVTTQRIQHVDIFGLDPFPTTSTRTVEAILGGIFLVLGIPLHFEFRVEELFDVMQGNVIGGAAFGGHVLRIGEGKVEDAAEAGMAHTMGASKAGGAGGRVGGEAGEAFDPKLEGLEALFATEGESSVFSRGRETRTGRG